jgi:tRNA pseudouridine13 synthase
VRLKVSPGDFRVREELEFEAVAGGEYYVHSVRKEKLDTPQALARIAKLANVSRADIAFAGLKDRQGSTEQWITIRGRRLDHRSRDLTVQFRGRTDRPISSAQSRGNRFAIVLRDLSDSDVERLQHNAAAWSDGLPNYFDDQRFGCLRHGQGFAMLSVLRGDHATALHRLLARPSPKAITGDVKLKRILAEHWGDWEGCARVARGPMYQRVFRHLVEHPDDFAQALALLPERTKLIHAFAYQSFLWNRTVDRMLHGMLGRARVTLPTIAGPLVAWDAPAPELARRLEALDTPLYGIDSDGAGSPEYRAALAHVLADEGLGAEDFARPAPHGMVLRHGARDLVLRPRGFELSELRRDETSPGRHKMRVRFGLPRGSYATLVVKRLLAGPRPRQGR